MNEFDDLVPEENTEGFVGDEGNEEWELPEGFDSSWEATEEEIFADVPPGSYSVVVETAQLTTAKTSRARMISWVLSILDEGKFAGRKLFKHHVLTKVVGTDDQGRDTHIIHPKTIGRVKGDLSICQITLPQNFKRADLEEICETLPGLILKVKVSKQREGDGVNVNFTALEGKYGGNDSGPAGDGTAF